MDEQLEQDKLELEQNRFIFEKEKFTKEQWRSVMLTQYSIFGVMTGLEMTALAIFASLSTQVNQGPNKAMFILSVISLVLQVIFIVLLINAEREIASGNECYLGGCHFQGKEKIYRWILMFIIFISWGLIALLLILPILKK